MQMEIIPITNTITLHYNDMKDLYCTGPDVDIISINIMLSKQNNTKDNNTKENIITMVRNKLQNHKSIHSNIVDKYYIFGDSKRTKHNIDSIKLYMNYKKHYKPSTFTDIIPPNLRLSEQGLYKMIMNEITNINTNMLYPHYIVVNNDNIFDLSFRITCTDIDVEINIILSSSYPFIPPTVEYKNPRIKIELLSAIINMDIWNINTWNYTITLEWLICNLATILEPHLMKHICIDNTTEENSLLEMKIMELYSMVGYTSPYNIQLPIVKNIKVKDAKYWKAGTGYGNYDNSEWNINKFIDGNILKNEKIYNILSNILSIIAKNIDDHINPLLCEIVEKQFETINLMVFNEQNKIYTLYLDILNKIIKTSKINISNSTRHMVRDINNIIMNETLVENIKDLIPSYLYFIETINKIIVMEKSISSENNTQIEENLQSKYIDMVEEYNYDTMELDKKHRYYTNHIKSIKPNTIVRIMSEFSTIQQSLPKSWDSSILFRIIPSNMNMCSFMIVGPKDTPYHNGLFEFHAYFPDNYPQVVPQVLLYTTGNDMVRFNPNLYANGKVCLSLLGTWSGQAGESWVPNLSTFIQVMISIQSLIMVDEPYFNEPGYEKDIGTDRGKKNSMEYNDNIRYETVRLGMIDILRNKSPEYEDFITEHFKMKKDDIIMTVSKWVDESKNKDRFSKLFDELKDLF
jgi:ubiquitin-protein ligase